MAEWNLYTGSYDAAENLAIDDLMLEKASEGQKCLRIFDFNETSVVLARTEDFGDLKSTEGIDYSRRDTGGSAIVCNDGVLSYSVAIPAGKNDYPENLHRNYFGPKIADALNDLGVDKENLGVGEHFSVRIDGGTVSGNSQRKKNDAVLYHGVIALEPWDTDELDELIELRQKNGESEKEFIESLPGVKDYVDYELEELKYALTEEIAEKFTSGSYSNEELTEHDKERVSELSEKYRDEDWIRTAYGQKGLKQDQGFCFVDWTDEWSEEVEEYGFY